MTGVQTCALPISKSHVYNICNKVGVDRRVELIEMFRWSLDDDENRK